MKFTTSEMDLRVAAAEKCLYAKVVLSPETQAELINNAEYCGEVTVTQEFILSFFTDANGNKVMLLMESFRGNEISESSAERVALEFKERLAEGTQLIHLFANTKFLFKEASMFCERNECTAAYNLAICRFNHKAKLFKMTI